MTKLSAVLPFFRTQLAALGYKEWDDSFNFENIPSSLIDKRFHLELQDALGVRNNQLDQEISVPVLARIFLKGYRNTSSARDDAIARGQTILETILKPEVRVGEYPDGLKNVSLESMSTEAAKTSNDNLIVLNLTFSCLIFLDT